MELSEKVENIGGSGYGGLGGCGLFLMAIFLVALFSLFRRHDGHGEHGLGLGALGLLGNGLPVKETCADKLLLARHAQGVDPTIAHLYKDYMARSGDQMKQQAVDTGLLRHEISNQTRDLILNQEHNARDAERLALTIARDQERAFYQAQIDSKNEKIAEGRERAIMLEGRLLQAQSEREADHRHFATKTQLDSIQCNMVSRPPFYPYGGVASINPCYGVNNVGAYGNSCSSCA